MMKKVLGMGNALVDVLARIDDAIYKAQLDQATAKKAQDQALLANSNPIGTIFSSLFISYIQVGGSAMQPNFSSESTDIIIAVIIYLAAFALLMKGVIQRFLESRIARKSDPGAGETKNDTSGDATNAASGAAAEDAAADEADDPEDVAAGPESGAAEDAGEVEK